MLEGGTEFDLQVLDKFEEEKRSEGDEAARKEKDSFFLKSLQTSLIWGRDKFCQFGQGILKGGVSLYLWPPVWLVWISPFCKKKCRSHTADSKPVKQEVNSTVILSPLVFPDSCLHIYWCCLHLTHQFWAIGKNPIFLPHLQYRTKHIKTSMQENNCLKPPQISN